MLSFLEKDKCTGCTACMAACPIACIKMVQNDEGFFYPEAEDRCINCGKCQRVCPIHNPESAGEISSQEAYAALTKDHRTWQKSASGGAFSEICRAWDNGNTVFAGAAWDGLAVHHICVSGVEHIAPLRKSKYIASNMEQTFSEIKKELDAGRRLLFCGTPCQVAGLKRFLGRPYEQLLLVDLICHGVGSIAVFHSCIRQIEKQYGKVVKAYEFRAKRNVHEADHIQRVRFENGDSVFLEKDPYMQLFLSQTCLRSSCGKNCMFRTSKREGDITIADFKGLDKVFPELCGTKKNYSTIVFNTEKGRSLLGALGNTMELRKCDIADISAYNPLFSRQTWFSEERDSFFADYVSNPEEAIEVWTKPAKERHQSVKRRVWNCLPVFVRKIVCRLRQK